MKELYCNYLLSQNNKCTAVGLSNLTNKQISHDEVTRFLNNEEYSAKEIWEYVKPTIRGYKSKETKVLIFDDTISEKPHSQTNKIINWQYDHSKNRNVKGINILTGFYTCEKLNIPVSYHTVEKEIEYKDKKTGKKKRKSKTTKNEEFRKMLSICKSNKLEYKYVLADSWYCSKDNINYIIEEIESKFIIGIKSNRLIKKYDEKKEEWSEYSQIKKQEIDPDRTYKIKVKGVEAQLTLVKKVFKNGDGSVGILYLISNELEMNAKGLYELYQKRWRIEVYHKNIKNHASLSKSPTKVERSQKNHINMSIRAYSKNEKLKVKGKYKNQRELSEILLLEANKASMRKLLELQKELKLIA